MTKTRCTLLALALVCTQHGAASAALGDIKISSFLERVDRLQSRGAFAMFSSDRRLLRREAEGAVQSYISRMESDRDAGRSPHSCPPKRDDITLAEDDFLAHLRSYSAARQRSTTLTAAIADLAVELFPCRSSH